jgi:hypothetical protein
MKGKGTKYERETIINFNEEEGFASIWTASETVYRQLLKRGYKPKKDGERHAVFEMPKGEVKLPRRKRSMSPAQKQSLVAARKGHFGRFQSVGAASGEGISPQGTQARGAR